MDLHSEVLLVLVSRSALFCFDLLCCVVLCCVVLCNVVLCCFVVRGFVQWCVALCFVVCVAWCCVVLCCGKRDTGGSGRLQKEIRLIIRVGR